MHVHEAIARTLREQGIDTVFGLIGDGNLFMIDSFVRAGGHYVSVAHESSGVLAANGWARITGRVGVATVTHGPAFTNITTALVESTRSRTPLVVLAGDTAVRDRNNLQNIDQRAVTAVTGAGFEAVRAPETLAVDIATAFRRAELERRPIVLDVPADFQWQEVELDAAPGRAVVHQATSPSEQALDEALGLIASSRRPVVLAGRGASDPEGREAVLRLARRIGAPVATTLQARELFRSEPEDLGICGTLSEDRAIEVITGADCLISFGAALTTWTTDSGSLVADTRIVQVDHDPTVFNEHTRVDAPVLGDCVSVAGLMVERLDEAQVKPSGYADRLTPRPARTTAPLSAELDLSNALDALEQRLPQRRNVVIDAGRFFYHAATRLTCGSGGRYVHTLDFGSIGLGVGNAIGAKVAAPDRTTVLVTGDGGFMLGGLTELSTAIRLGIDLVVVVLNDGAYGAEHIQFTNRDMNPLLSVFDWPDFAEVATAMGGRGYSVHTQEDLAAALLDLEIDPSGTVLLDVHVDPHGIDSPYHH